MNILHILELLMNRRSSLSIKPSFIVNGKIRFYHNRLKFSLKNLEISVFSQKNIKGLSIYINQL
jgi:hypothetical protein